MQNLNMENLKAIPMPIHKDYFVISRQVTPAGVYLNVMTYISEEEESKLERNVILKLHRGNRDFVIDPSDSLIRRNILYGTVDFTKNSDDMILLNNQLDLSFLGPVGIRIYSDYDYDTHTCYTPNKMLRWTETWTPSVICRFAHGTLGKPERVAIFKMLV